MTEQGYHRVRVGVRRFALSRHALERYVERVKPALDTDLALAELKRILPAATLAERPGWAPSGTPENAAHEWVMLTDAITFPVIDGHLVSCLTRGEVGAEIRFVRSSERRDRAQQARQPGTRKKYGKVARDQRRRAQRTREELNDG